MRLLVLAATLPVAFAAAVDYYGEHGPTTVLDVDFCNASWWEVTGAPEHPVSWTRTILTSWTAS